MKVPYSASCVTGLKKVWWWSVRGAGRHATAVWWLW